MNGNRLPDYLSHRRLAVSDALSFVKGSSKTDFLEDKRTQQAVILSLIVLGEASTKVMDRYPEFAGAHPQIPWRNMRGMRNRIAHGYFDFDLHVLWDTIQTALPLLSEQLNEIEGQP